MKVQSYNIQKNILLLGQLLLKIADLSDNVGRYSFCKTQWELKIMYRLQITTIGLRTFLLLAQKKFEFGKKEESTTAIEIAKQKAEYIEILICRYINKSSISNIALEQQKEIIIEIEKGIEKIINSNR